MSKEVAMRVSRARQRAGQLCYRQRGMALLVAGLIVAGACGTAALLAACRATPGATEVTGDDAVRAPRRRVYNLQTDPFLDDLERRTFRFFWERANPSNGLVPDRWPTPSFASVAALGFGLTAYPVGVERGWIAREQARERVLTTLRFLTGAPQGPAATGMTGYHGFFYHFLDISTGARWAADVELSTIDTALLMAGVLTCQNYFDGDDPDEAAIRELAEGLFERVEWTWPQPRPPLVSMGWTPETGFHYLDWRGYNEAMILYILALGSPSHPIAAEAWPDYASTYAWCTFYGQEGVAFGPLFGHQFSHVWVDFRGIADAAMRGHGLDYFENSRRATLAQRAYAIDNPMGWSGYGQNVWGLTACDGPADITMNVNGSPRRFFTYAARSVSCQEVRDDGTVAPYAAGASLPFAPELALPALKAMKARWGDWLYGDYGFFDAFNPTFTWADRVGMGRVVAGQGWFDTDYLGIDQGPMLAMIENARSGLFWRLLRGNPVIVRGLRRAGFSGGWLDASPLASNPPSKATRRDPLRAQR